MPRTDDVMVTAQRFLQDGASYDEVARTVGVSRELLQRNLPGHSWELGVSASFTAQTRKLWKRVDRVWSIYADRAVS